MDRRAIVIGAGIGGLGCAIALRMAGWQVDVCEQRAELAENGAGIALAANAMRALERLGVAARVRDGGAAVGTAELRTWDGRLLAELPVDKMAAAYGTDGYMIHRRKLQAILCERLAELGAGVRWNRKLAAFEQRGGMVSVCFEGGEQAEGDLLIGADGIHSVVRERLHGHTPLRYSGYAALRGIGDYEGPGHGLAAGGGFEAFGRGVRFGFTQLGEGRVFWFAAMNMPEGQRLQAEQRRHVAERTFRDWYAPVPAVIAATRAEDILFHPIHDRRPLRRWSGGSVTLLGDAAHPMLPNLGQGGAQAMEDALVLADMLRGVRTRGDIADALIAYDKLRIPRTSRIVRQSRQMGRIMQLENRALIAARNMALRAAAATLFVRRLHGVVGYRLPRPDEER